ncbi:hypothetical protein NDU88_000038 [Pleurodeles waltl]|uniref:DUF4939 domain-containing protein n=1 Tax=Pleurodeles waltl TaxID=8319 RepID=A0AAV7Q2W1_PLEWA|nr:hypothetical protein NDU88_000038 [Pleurodeles waltl]
MVGHRQDPEHQGGHGATGTPPTLGGHPQLSLRRLLAPAANVLPSFPAVGAQSVVDPQGPDVLGDGTPNILLLVGADLHEMYRGRREVISNSTVEVTVCSWRSIAYSTVATRKSRPFLGQSRTLKIHASRSANSRRKQHVSRDRLQRQTIPTSSNTMEDTVVAAADPDHSLLTTIQQQAQEIQQLRSENAALRQALAFRSGDVPTLSASTHRFSGEPTELREFLDSLTVYFAFRPTQFSQDRTKVGYLISALSGPALAWATPMVSSNDPVLSDYSAFVNRFKQMFSRPGLEASAEEALCDIHQGSQDVLQYITRFRQLGFSPSSEGVFSLWRYFL